VTTQLIDDDVNSVSTRDSRIHQQLDLHSTIQAEHTLAASIRHQVMFTPQIM